MNKENRNKTFSPEEIRSRTAKKHSTWRDRANPIAEQLRADPDSIQGYFTKVTIRADVLKAQKQQSALYQVLKKLYKGDIHTGVRWLTDVEDHPNGFWVLVSTKKDGIPGELVY